MELFATGDDGNLWHKWQGLPNSPFEEWASLGRPGDRKLVLSPAVTRNKDGRLELFNLAMDWTIRNNPQIAPSDGWGGWGNLGKPGTVGLNSPVVAANQDGRMEVFAIDDNGDLQHKWQTAPNNGWSGWQSMGRPPGTTLQSVAVGSNLDGRMEAVALAADGNLWRKWQVAPNSYWSGWSSLGCPGGVLLNAPPVITRNQDGRLEVFITGSDGTLWHFWQTAPNSGSSGWQSLAKPAGAMLSDPAVGRNLNGRLMVFLRGSNGEVWYRQQSFTQVTLQQGVGGYVGCLDTMILKNLPNLSSPAMVFVGVRSLDLYSALIRFDLTGKIPAGATVIKATLQLYPYDQYPLPSAQPIKLFRLLRDWTNLATYNQAATGVLWGKPGANDTTTDRLGTASATATWSTTGWKSFDVTSLVKTWYATPSTNKGMIIKDYAATEQFFSIYSSEYATVAQRPKLTIVYAK